MFTHHEQRPASREHFIGATRQVRANDVFVARQVKGQAVTELLEDQGRAFGRQGLCRLDICARLGSVRSDGGEFFGRAIVTILCQGFVNGLDVDQFHAQRVAGQRA